MSRIARRLLRSCCHQHLLLRRLVLLLTTTASATSAASFFSTSRALLSPSRSLPILGPTATGSSTRRLVQSTTTMPIRLAPPQPRPLLGGQGSPLFLRKSNDDDAAPSSPELEHQQRLVLIGGGHAHVQVIKALRCRPDRVNVVLIDSQRSATYSGMVPGCVAGMYSSDETRIDLAALAAASNIDFVHGAVTDLCLATKTVEYRPHAVVDVGLAASGAGANDCAHVRSLNDSRPLSSVPFDVISIDVGSSSRDLHSVPGAARFSIPTRPIHRLVARLEEARCRMLQNAWSSPVKDPRVVVVGGGAAGLELAFAVMARWRAGFPNAECTIVNAAPKLLDLPSSHGGTPTAQDETLKQVLREKRICVLNECVVTEVGEDFVVVTTTSGQGSEARRIAATHGIWAAGAGPTRLAQNLLEKRTVQLHESNDENNSPTNVLDMTEDGWIEVSNTLQSTSHPFVFAAGDCASIRVADDYDNERRRSERGSQPQHHFETRRVVPKAGVYAVRAGPILIENLTRYLDQILGPAANPNSVEPPRPLVRYHPQDDFLKLVVCDVEEALGFRFGLALRGRWVWRLKDRIDRTFMDLFRVESSSTVGREGDADTGPPSTPYDTAQYDSTIDADPTLPTLEPHDAAVLLQHQDDDVNFLLAWKVLRTMASDKDYREAVLSLNTSKEQVIQDLP